MTLRWVVLLLMFVVPVLALVALLFGPPLNFSLSVIALALGLVAAVLWLVGMRGPVALPDDEMAHDVKNRVAAALLVLENVVLVGVLLAAVLTDLDRLATLKLVYALVLLSIWAYGVTVAVTWRAMGR